MRTTCFKATTGVALILLPTLIAASALFLRTARVAAASSGSSTVLYVATNGNDLWSGRLAAPNGKGDGPFATVAKARDAIRALKNAGRLTGPATVQIRGGEYFLDQALLFTPADSGSKDARISYESYPGDSAPILSGGRRITGWGPAPPLPGLPAVAQGHVMMAAIAPGWQIFELTINGQPMARAANPGDLSWEQWPRATGEADHGLRASPGPLAVISNLKDADIDVKATTGFNIISPIAELNPQGTVAKLSRIYPFKSGESYPFRIENTPSGMVEPGRWFVDSAKGVIYLWPPAGVNPASANVVGAWLVTLLELRGGEDPAHLVSFLNVFGLTFSDANRQRVFRATPDQLKGPIDGASTRDSAILIRGATYCNFERCAIKNVAGNGALALYYAQQVYFINNQISNCGGSGIGFTGYNPGTVHLNFDNLIQGNTIRECGETYWHSAGIGLAMAGNITIRGNTVADMPYVGIAAGGGTAPYFRQLKGNNNYFRWNEIGETPLTVENVKRFIPGNVLIEGNTVHDVMQLGQDGGGIYLWGQHNCTVRHNVVYRTIQDISWGIYFDNDTIDSTMRDNLVYLCPLSTPAKAGGAFLLNGNGRNTVTNNIFALGNRLFTFHGGYGGDVITHNIFYFGPLISPAAQPLAFSHDLAANPSVMDYNLYWSAAGGDTVKTWLQNWRKGGWDLHSIIGDPGFLDSDHDNFTLGPNSPAPKIGFVPFR